MSKKKKKVNALVKKFFKELRKQGEAALEERLHDLSTELDEVQYFTDEEIAQLLPVKLLALDVDGVLTDGKLHISANGEIFKSFNAKDGLGISVALRNGLEIALITGRESAIIHRRAEELGIKHVLENVKDKNAALTELRNQLGLAPEEIAYMGDDLNDLPAMMAAGVTFAPDDAVEDVCLEADFVTVRAGGDGAVREAIEMILDAQDKWNITLGNYLVQGQGDKQ